MSNSDSQPRSRFLIRRRIIEVLIILWVIAYVGGFFKDSPPSPASQPYVSTSPAARNSP